VESKQKEKRLKKKNDEGETKPLKLRSINLKGKSTGEFPVPTKVWKID